MCLCLFDRNMSTSILKKHVTNKITQMFIFVKQSFHQFVSLGW